MTSVKKNQSKSASSSRVGKGGLQVLRGLLRTKRLRQDSTETEVDIIALIAP